jgi:hypothetical protein
VFAEEDQATGAAIARETPPVYTVDSPVLYFLKRSLPKSGASEFQGGSLNRILENIQPNVNTIYIISLSLALVGGLFLLKGDIGLDLSDEGHLWYGASQTAQGEVPIRDFRSYDPGRYYWTAGWFQLFGPGIIALRIANGLFQVIGLTFGLLAVSRVVSNRWLLIIIGVLLAIWMFPRHKLYEHSLAMSAVFFVLILIERPTLKRHFIAGVFVGTTAFFGRNFGVYSFITFLVLIIFVVLKVNGQMALRKIAAWAGGIALGFSPMFLIVIFIPDFLTSFIDSIYLTFSPGAPVLSLPIPWP